MTENDKARLIQWAITRPARWYVDHPNADRAAALILKAFERPHPPPPANLTIRHLQILGGKACGLSDRQIASLLGVEVETVKTHAKNAYRVLGASTPSGAVATAMRGGWI